MLSVIGTGDTMAGVIAALLVQGIDRAEAAELGAWIVGKAGELAVVARGNGVVARSMWPGLPHEAAIRSIERFGDEVIPNV